MPEYWPEYAIEQVRKTDYPHYVTTLFAPREKRGALFVLYALQLELVKIRSLVRENMMGMIRLQWWRDAIEKLYQGEVLRHPIIEDLYHFIKCDPLWQKQDFFSLIDAYEDDLHLPDNVSEQEAWQHAEKMGIARLSMACLVYGTPIAEPLLRLISGAEHILQAMRHDQRFAALNKQTVAADISQKIKLVDKRILKETPLILSYRLIKWQEKAIKKERVPNEQLLAFNLWLGSFNY